MNIQQIRFFVAVNEFEKFTIAADEMNISQSSLSKHIDALEKELGVRLFRRGGSRPTELTDIGRALLVHANRILEEYDTMIGLADPRAGDKTGLIRLGAMPFLEVYKFLEGLFEFETLHPKYHIDITETATANILRMLTGQKLDIGILRMSAFDNYESLRIIPLFDEEQVLLAGPQHRFASRTHIRLCEAADERFLQFYTDPMSAANDLRLIRHAITDPRIDTTTMKLESIKQVILKKNYVSIVPRQVAVSIFLPEAQLIALTDPSPPLRLCVVTHKNHKLSRACRELLAYISSAFKKPVSGQAEETASAHPIR